MVGEPVEGTLFFAGEATDLNGQNGTVQGGNRKRKCNGPVKLDTKLLFESVSHNDRSDH